MKHKLIAHEDLATPPRTYALILESGEEFTECLAQFATQTGSTASHYTAIGAFSRVVLGYFDWEKKEYRGIPLDEQVEVVSLLGDIALKDGEPSLHTHVTVAKSDGTAWGGHLLSGTVRPTLEVILRESPASLVRRPDPVTGLALIEID